jgi:hypothetical protein
MARRCSTICLPVSKEAYRACIDSPSAFRAWLDAAFRDCPELFPKAFAQGYRLKDSRFSAKRGIRLRRVVCKATGCAFSVRPCFVLPYMAGWANDVEGPLFLRAFGVPFWALARVFGRGPMYWYRLEVSLGRNRIVGTTVRRAALPGHLLADEHHQSRDGQKNYLATTVAEGCCLGCALAPTATAEDLQAAYAIFKQEAQDVQAGYQPRTVNTDGWAATQQARLAEHPQSRQAERGLRDAVGQGVGRLSRVVPEELCPAAEASVGMGAGAGADGVAARTGGEAVRQVEGVRQGVQPPGRPPDEQHAGPPDAVDEPVLRGCSASAWQRGGVRVALPGVGIALQLPAVAPGGGAGQRRVAKPGRAAQPTPLPRRLTSESPGLCFSGRIPALNGPAPNSGTVRKKEAAHQRR